MILLSSNTLSGVRASYLHIFVIQGNKILISVILKFFPFVNRAREPTVQPSVSVPTCA